MNKMFKQVSFDLCKQLKIISIKKRIGRTISPSNLQYKKSSLLLKHHPLSSLHLKHNPLSFFRWNRKFNSNLKLICYYSTDIDKRVHEEFSFERWRPKKIKKRLLERLITKFNPTMLIGMFFLFLVLAGVGLYIYFTLEPKERLLRFIAETIYRSVLDSQESLNIAEIEDFKPTYTLRVLEREVSGPNFFWRMNSYLYKMKSYLMNRPISQIGDLGGNYLLRQPAMAMTVNIPLKTGGFLKLTYDIFYNDETYRVGKGVEGKISPYEHQVIQIYRKIRDFSYEMEPLPKSAPVPYMSVFYKDSYTSDRDNIELNKMFEEKI